MTPTTTQPIRTAYKTFDMYVAAFLVARGHVLQRLEGTYRRTFVFPGDAAEDAEMFYKNAPVPAIDYAHALKDTKARLHAAS
jgi:hypothetical protein